MHELCELDLGGAVDVLLGLPLPERFAGLGDGFCLGHGGAAVWRCLTAGILLKSDNEVMGDGRSSACGALDVLQV